MNLPREDLTISYEQNPRRCRGCYKAGVVGVSQCAVGHQVCLFNLTVGTPKVGNWGISKCCSSSIHVQATLLCAVEVKILVRLETSNEMENFFALCVRT